jgi:hypothetical protein
MIDVYILLSNEFRFLNIQVELIKKYVKDVGNIYGVMGPIGGLKILSQNSIKDIQINQIVLPPSKQFFAPKQLRIARIVNFLTTNYINKSGNPGLILHADVFPISTFEMPKEYSLIGRGSNNRSNFSVTWIACQPNSLFANYKVDKSYSTMFPQGDWFKKVFGINKDPDINIEWCNPCFIHTDNSSSDCELNNGKFEKKLDFLKEYLKLKENIEFDESAVLPQDLISLTKRYAKEREAWVAAGKPLRTPEEIERIFRICSGCPFFFANSSVSGSCSICGCQIKKRGKLMNKAAWATTECPKTPSEWLPNKNPEIFAKKDVPIKKCCGK